MRRQMQTSPKGHIWQSVSFCSSKSALSVFSIDLGSVQPLCCQDE